MKKILFLNALFCLSISGFETTAAKPTASTAVSATKDRFGKKNKNGSFSRKRSGFLGLFGKKKSCDCPRH